MKKFLAFTLALLMVLTVCVSTATATYYVPASDVGGAAVSAVTVDGVISENEWGTPSLHGTKETNWGTSGWDFWQQITAPTDESYDVWLDHDDNFAYIAVRLNNTFEADICTSVGDLWDHASLAFTISAYDAATTVPRIYYEGNYYEQYNYYAMGLVNGTKANFGLAQGTNAYTLDDNEYAITFDDATNTYVYEMAIPLSKTNLTADSEGMVFTMDLRTPLGPGAPYASRYLVTQIAQTAGDYAGAIGANNFMHTWSNPLVVVDDDAVVTASLNDTFADTAENVVIDGTVTEEEWGEPIIVTNPDDCQDKWGNFWSFSPDNVSKLQTAKIYATNDEYNIYLACTLDHVNLDQSCTDAGALYAAAHFGFTFSSYDETNTVKRIEFGGDNYEQYTGYMMGLVNGTKAATTKTQGITAVDLAAEDYAIKYDAATKTYTYEVVIPLSNTNINIYDSREIAMSFDVGMPYSGNLYNPSNSAANRFNITTAAAFCGGANNFAHAGNALKFNMADARVLPETWVKDKASLAQSITLDGTITEEEWGEAVISTTPDDCQAKWSNFWQYNPSAVDRGQNAKVYLANDHDYIYVGATLNRCDLDNGCTDAAEMWKYADFGFTLSAYDNDNTVKHIEFEGQEYEQYTSYRIGLVNGAPTAYCYTQGLTAVELPKDCYTVKYDDTTDTYTYEMKIPYSYTNVDMSEGLDVAMSIQLAQEKVGDTPANLYNIGGTAMAFCGGPNNTAHKDNALKFTLNDCTKKVATWVDENAPATKGITLDGVITESEWGGRAVVSTTPKDCQEKWGNFWQFNPATVNNEQNAKIYLSNDEDYLYIGATLDEADFDDTCKSVSDLYKAAHFGFSISGYDEENTVKHIEFEGKEYEQYTCFMMGFVNGKKASYTSTQGHEAWELPEEDYAITYDEETRTYTYEARIPFSKMNVTSTKVAVSASVGCPYSGGDAANRYNITTGMATCGGADNFAHKNNALVFNLMVNPKTGDNFNLFAVCAVMTVALAGVTTLLVIRRKACNK